MVSLASVCISYNIFFFLSDLAGHGFSLGPQSYLGLLLLAGEARPSHRSKRGLGLIKLGYDWATQGLSAGIQDGILSGFSDLTTSGKIGAGLMVAKPLALTLLGKCKY